MSNETRIPTRLKLGIVGAGMFGFAAFFVALIFSGSDGLAVVGAVGLVASLLLGGTFLYGAAKNLVPDAAAETEGH